MADSDPSQICPHEEIDKDSTSAEASMSGNNDTGNTIGESLADDSSSSQSFITEMSTSASTDLEDHTLESSTSGSTSRTDRGRNGKKWIGKNHKIIEKLKKDNEGTLSDHHPLMTSPFPHQDEWSEDNLPVILFYVKPPKSIYDKQEPGLLKEDGKVVKVDKSGKLDENGTALRDIEILPRHISLLVPGWLVEAWRRTDPRITYADILDRQTEDADLGLRKLRKNALQNHSRRQCRMVLNSWTSYERRQVPHRTDVQSIESLSYQNIMLNTILNVCPSQQDRLTKVRLVRRSQDDSGRFYSEPLEVTAMNLYQTTFPIDHFILESEVPQDGLHSMDRSMLAAWELTLILQERTRIHGLSHWKHLADRCLPVSWFDRTKKKRVENETYDGGCSVCTWDAGRDQRLHKEWIDEITLVCSKPANRKPLSKKVSSSGPSKRRKLKNGKSQNVSTESADASSKDRECCKEVESYLESGSTSELYPSDQFRRGEFKSYFRDADCVVDTQLDNVAHKEVEQRMNDEEWKHREIHQAVKHNGNLGTGDGTMAEDRESQLSNSLLTLPVSVQNSDSRINVGASQELANIDPAILESSSAEKDLNEIGSHLIMDGAKYPPQNAQNEVAMMSPEQMDADVDMRNFPLINVPLPQGFGAGWNQEEDLQTLWWRQTAPAFQDQGSISAIKEMQNSTGLYNDWPGLNVPSATEFDVNAKSNMSLSLDLQKQAPVGWNPISSGQGTNLLLTQSHPLVYKNNGLHQEWAPSIESQSTFSQSSFSQSSDKMPSLTNSFQTESGFSANTELAGSQNLVDSYGNFTEVDKPANLVGFSTVENTTTTTLSGEKGKNVLREPSPGFLYDTNPTAFHEGAEVPDGVAANPGSGGSMYQEDGNFNNFSSPPFMEDGQLYDFSQPLNDVAMLGLI